MSNRIRRMGEWLVWFAHAPLSGYWLLDAVLAVAAVVTVFHSPKEALGVLASLGTVVGATEVAARAKGVPAWPTRTAYDAHRALEAPDALQALEAGDDLDAVGDPARQDEAGELDRRIE